jgi:hypothetical protein
LKILIINFITTLMILPYICGIQIKNILQKVQCDTKNGPLYLVTTPPFYFLAYNKKSQRLNTRDLQSNSCKWLIKRHQFFECSPCIKNILAQFSKCICFILYHLLNLMHPQLLGGHNYESKGENIRRRRRRRSWGALLSS